MATSLVLTVKSELSVTHLRQRYQLASGKPKEQALALIELFRRLAGGVESGSLDVQTGAAAPAAAAGTFTLVSVIATDAITIGTTTFTFTSTPSLATDVEVDGSGDAADATALAAAINAHSTVSQIVTATVADNVVTIAAKQKGVVGNFIPISSADTTITASGSFLAGGTGGVTDEAVHHALGIA